MNTFSDPLKIIKQVDIPENSNVADFGCGSGAYSILIAKKLITGKVFAIDVRKDMVERLSNIADSERYDNIHVVWGDVDEKEGSRLRDNSIDYVFIVNTLFQLEDKKAALNEALRIMKHDAHIIIVDWSESYGNIGPEQRQVVNENTAKLLIEETGFIYEKELQAGEHHYGFVARKL